ncbi:MAG: zinc-binding dehydrogenase, partial [Dehalococcoidia bacterium]
VRFGDTVAILGAGTIGLLTIAAAKVMGATHVAITARHAHQRAMAVAIGADAVYDATDEGIARMAADLGGADVVVETVGGHADTLGHAMTIAGPSARISVLGAFTQPVQLHPIFFFLKELRLVGSNCYGRGGRRSDYELAIEIMRRNADKLRALITHRFPLDRIDDAYATADDKSSGAIKVHITP